MNLENYFIPHRQTNKQPLNLTLSSKNLENINNFQDWGLILVARKKISVRKIKVELLKQYVVSLKKVVYKDRASRIRKY